MKNIKKHIILPVVMLLAVLTGCQRIDGGGSGRGYLSLGGITLDNGTNSRDEVAKASLPVFEITITDIEGGVVYTNPDHTSITEPINLPTGTYTVSAQTLNGSPASWDQKVYKGSSEVTIRNSVTEEVAIECGLDNVLVDAVWSENVKNNFSEYQIEVSHDLGSLTFVKDETRAGYFSSVTELNYRIDLTDNLGDTHFATGTITGLKSKDFVHVQIDVEPRSDGGKEDMAYDLIINTKINEKVTKIRVALSSGDSEKPAVTLVGGDINAPIVVKEGVGENTVLSVTAAGGVKKVFFNVISEGVSGIPVMTELLAAGQQQLDAIGVSTDLTDGSLAGEVDMSGFTRIVPSDETGTRNIEMSLGVYDNNFNYITQKFTLQVISASIFTQEPVLANTIDWSSGRGTTPVTFAATWGGNVVPQNAIIRYRIVGDDWTNLTVAEMNVNEAEKRMTADVNLYLGRNYEVQAVNEGDEGKIVEFRTVNGPLLDNMSFDNWFQKGKVWLPYAEGGIEDWDSGNGGVTFVSESNTVPEYDIVKVGTAAAKLTSVKVTMVGFAAGNLFTGYFLFDLGSISNPKSMVHFGRPFSGRPTHFAGYYMYKPVAINSDDKPEGWQEGDMDKCNIYISLENWGGADVKERPAEPIIIGYAGILTSEENADYVRFELPIEYYSDEMPDHILIVATSSYLGENFMGGIGSTLYVDGFDLIY